MRFWLTRLLLKDLTRNHEAALRGIACASLGFALSFPG